MGVCVHDIPARRLWWQLPPPRNPFDSQFSSWCFLCCCIILVFYDAYILVFVWYTHAKPQGAYHSPPTPTLFVISAALKYHFGFTNIFVCSQIFSNLFNLGYSPLQSPWTGATQCRRCALRYVRQRGDRPHIDGQIPGRTEDHRHSSHRSARARTDGQPEEGAQVEQLRDGLVCRDAAPEPRDLQGVSEAENT